MDVPVIIALVRLAQNLSDIGISLLFVWMVWTDSQPKRGVWGKIFWVVMAFIVTACLLRLPLFVVWAIEQAGR